MKTSVQDTASAAKSCFMMLGIIVMKYSNLLLSEKKPLPWVTKIVIHDAVSINCMSNHFATSFVNVSVPRYPQIHAVLRA